MRTQAVCAKHIHIHLYGGLRIIKNNKLTID